MAETLESLVDAIPEAERGEPITIEHHNTLRTVVKELAKRPAGGGPVGGPAIFSFAPTLLSLAEGGASGNSWEVHPGFVEPPETEGEDRGADGWMPIQLPEGFVIEKLIVRGSLQASSDPNFDVKLIRQIIGTTQLRTLANADPRLADILPNSEDIYVRMVSATGPEEDLRVKNEESQYHIRATLDFPPADVLARIFSIQIAGDTS